MDNNVCYTINQVTDLLKISRQTLTNWRKNGVINTIQIEGRVLIRKDEIDRLLGK